MQAHAQASSAASLFTGQAEAIKQQLEAFMSEEHRWPQQLLHKLHGKGSSVSGEEAAEALRQLSHSAGVPLVEAAVEAAEKLALEVGGMGPVCLELHLMMSAQLVGSAARWEHTLLAVQPALPQQRGKVLLAWMPNSLLLDQVIPLPLRDSCLSVPSASLCAPHPVTPGPSFAAQLQVVRNQYISSEAARLQAVHRADSQWGLVHCYYQALQVLAAQASQVLAGQGRQRLLAQVQAVLQQDASEQQAGTPRGPGAEADAAGTGGGAGEGAASVVEAVAGAAAAGTHVAGAAAAGTHVRAGLQKGQRELFQLVEDMAALCSAAARSCPGRLPH
jgi:hypothetical protein